VESSLAVNGELHCGCTGGVQDQPLADDGLDATDELYELTLFELGLTEYEQLQTASDSTPEDPVEVSTPSVIPWTDAEQAGEWSPASPHEPISPSIGELADA
jgi:hypothetical protein